jgi:hypothetical protein
MMDIVERLRMKGPMSFQMDWSDRAKAADEIERLREVIANMTNLSNDLWNIGATALMGEEDA